MRNDLDRRRAMGLLGAAACGSVLGGKAVEASGGGVKTGARKGVFPPSVKAASPTYSPAILAEGSKMLFVSGQGPNDLTADTETQIRQTFQNIQAVLEAAGASWENVTLLRSFFVNMKRDLPLYRKVRKEFLVEPYPASTAVGTTELAIAGLEIEIEAVALI